MRPRLDNLETTLDDIALMGRSQLSEHWDTLMCHEPPHNISSKLMRRALAYQAQVKALGGLRPGTQKQLRKIACSAGSICPVKTKSKIVIKPGTRLIREWNGKTYTVEAIDDGFIWQGQQHKSLSAIARAITGARWSGPRFFGL